MTNVNYDYIRSILDIVIVTYLLYKIVIVTVKTKAFQIIKGVLAVVLVWVLSNLMGLDTLKFIMTQVITYGIFGMFVVFQQELRQGLEKIGKVKIFGLSFSTGNITKSSVITVDQTVQAVEYLAKRNIGALITFEQQETLSNYINTGIEIDAKISKELLINIFTPNVPLHDGALIIRKDRVVSGSCYLPLSSNGNIPKELGTRHRAGIGVSESTDSITVIVSEETGSISIAYDSNLYRNLTKIQLKAILTEALTTNTKNHKKDIQGKIEECVMNEKQKG